VWISYFDINDASLRAARRIEGGWEYFVVDINQGAGFFNDIDVPAFSELPMIAFARSGGDKGLYFARFDGEAWLVETIVSRFGGYFCDMALDRGGVPYITYQNFDSPDVNSLHCVYFDGSQWVDEVVDDSGVTGFNSSIVIDDRGYAHVAYHNQNALYYAHRANGWSVRQLVAGVISGATGITLKNGYPAISFVRDGKPSYIDATGTTITPGGGGGGGTTTTTGGGGGCFISTAGFGTMSADAVTALTGVRDGALCGSIAGSTLVGLYYAISPSAAAGLSGSAALRAAVRELLD
jgi:hypothetical protein